MKINFFDEKNIVIYLNRFFTDNIDLEDASTLEDYFKQLFLRLHEYYHIELSGYYNIVIYHDQFYGMIIHLHKEDLEYYHYCDSEIDMRILIERHCHFLYEVEDIFNLDDRILQKGILYRYQNHFYVRLTKEISFLSLGKLLEQSKIVYQDTENIIRYGKKIALHK